MISNDDIQKAVIATYENSVSFDTYDVLVNLGIVPEGRKRNQQSYQKELSRVGVCIYNNGFKHVSAKRYVGKLLVSI